MNLLAVFTSVCLLGTILLANVLQMLTLVLWPFSRRAFRAANCAVAGAWLGLAVVWTEKVHGIRATFSGDQLPPRENAILVANHRQMPDVVAVLCLAYRQGRIGDLKWFVKDVIKYMPGVGWGMLFLDCVFLKRDWDKDESRIRATFAKYQREDIPFWLVSFPEGTRLTPAKLAAARAFATKAGHKPPERVLIPRTRGFASSVIGMRGRIDAVYDLTIGYGGKEGAPTLWQLFKMWRGDEFHVHVKRYPIDSLPADLPGLSKWLLSRFEEKDTLLGHYYANGRFLPQK